MKHCFESGFSYKKYGINFKRRKCLSLQNLQNLVWCNMQV